MNRFVKTNYTTRFTNSARKNKNRRRRGGVRYGSKPIRVQRFARLTKENPSLVKKIDLNLNISKKKLLQKAIAPRIENVWNTILTQNNTTSNLRSTLLAWIHEKRSALILIIASVKSLKELNDKLSLAWVTFTGELNTLKMQEHFYANFTGTRNEENLLRAKLLESLIVLLSSILSYDVKKRLHDLKVKDIKTDVSLFALNENELLIEENPSLHSDLLTSLSLDDDSKNSDNTNHEEKEIKQSELEAARSEIEFLKSELDKVTLQKETLEKEWNESIIIEGRKITIDTPHRVIVKRRGQHATDHSHPDSV